MGGIGRFRCLVVDVVDVDITRFGGESILQQKNVALHGCFFANRKRFDLKVGSRLMFHFQSLPGILLISSTGTPSDVLPLKQFLRSSILYTCHFPLE